MLTTRHSLVLLTWLIVPLCARADDKPESKLSDEEKKLVELTNEARAKDKLPPLRVQPQLMEAARKHSANMARQREMNHELDGKGPTQRVRDEKYDYAKVAENVAAGDNWPLADVVQAWMDSKLHRENIMNREYTEIGIGLAKDGNGKVYYTQVFGMPRRRR